MKKLLATLLILLPLSAYAGWFGKDEWEKEDCPKNHSLAWCLADYQGRSKGIYDMSHDEFAKMLKKSGMSETNIAGILHDSLGVGVAMGNFALGNLFGGGVFLLSALMPDQIDQNRGNPYVVFFYANTENKTLEQVRDIFNGAAKTAINASLSTLPKEAVVSTTDKGFLKIAIPGFDCSGRFDCLIASGFNGTAVKSLESKNTPPYLNGGQVISPTTGTTGGISLYHLPKEINRALLAKNISENLPPWVYWYIPAGYLGGNPMPLFLNQGKALFFVKPSPNDPMPVLPHVAAKPNAEEETRTATSQGN